MEKSEVLTLKQLGEYMKEVKFNETYAARFNRIIVFYTYDATQANILEFLTLVLDKPDAFKRTQDILKKWKTPSSVSQVFNSIINVCDIPKVKDQLGERYTDVVNAHNAYIKELETAAQEPQTQPAAPTKKTKTSKTKTIPTPETQSVQEGDHEQYERHKELHCVPPPSDADGDSYYVERQSISVERLLIYIQHLRRIGNPMADMIADLMESDMST